MHRGTEEKDKRTDKYIKWDRSPSMNEKTLLQRTINILLPYYLYWGKNNAAT